MVLLRIKYYLLKLNKKRIEILKLTNTPKPETSMETLTGLRTAFKKDGVVTAGNASELMTELLL